MNLREHRGGKSESPTHVGQKDSSQTQSVQSELLTDFFIFFRSGWPGPANPTNETTIPSRAPLSVGAQVRRHGPSSSS